MVQETIDSPTQEFWRQPLKDGQLTVLKKLKETTLDIFYNSQVIVRQIRGEFKMKEPQLTAYLEPAEELLDGLELYRISYVLRMEHQKANNLAK